MGRLLSYLFEVTERFGMETRTELILLQRTMVVVEGVARSLNPNINIWQVASPIVTDYIQKSIGPKAIVTDLYKTARVLDPFWPSPARVGRGRADRTIQSATRETAWFLALDFACRRSWPTGRRWPGTF